MLPGVVRVPRSTLFDDAHRMFGFSEGVTTRPELKLKVVQLELDHPEVFLINKPLVLRFFLHGRHDAIRFCSKPGAEGFLVKVGGDGKSAPVARKIRGIHGVLRKTFYPDFDRFEHDRLAKIDVAKKHNRNKSKSKSKKKTKSLVISHRSSLSSGCDWSVVDLVANDARGVGSELGKQVHKQLEIFARSKLVFARDVPNPDPLVTAVIDKIVHVWKLIPLWSEYEIWDETLRYATAVDMICLNPRNRRLVFFEVKTGYRDSFSFSTGKKIRGRFGIYSMPLSHAFLQLILPMETMKRHYGIRAIDGYVIHVNEYSGVTRYELPTRTQISYDRVYAYVLRGNKAEEKAKKEKRAGYAKRPGTKAPVRKRTRKVYYSSSRRPVQNKGMQKTRNGKRRRKVAPKKRVKKT